MSALGHVGCALGTRWGRIGDALGARWDALGARWDALGARWVHVGDALCGHRSIGVGPLVHNPVQPVRFSDGVCRKQTWPCHRDCLHRTFHLDIQQPDIQPCPAKVADNSDIPVASAARFSNIQLAWEVMTLDT